MEVSILTPEATSAMMSVVYGKTGIPTTIKQSGTRIGPNGRRIISFPPDQPLKLVISKDCKEFKLICAKKVVGQGSCDSDSTFTYELQEPEKLLSPEQLKTCKQLSVDVLNACISELNSSIANEEDSIERNRRSIRRYKSSDLPEDTIETMTKHHNRSIARLEALIAEHKKELAELNSRLKALN